MNKTETITIRVTKEDKERLQRLAKYNKITLSRFLLTTAKYVFSINMGAVENEKHYAMILGINDWD